MIPTGTIRPTRQIAALLALAALLGAAACREAESPGAYPAVNPTDCLPDVRLVDQRGREISLSSLKGKPVLIDFVYSSCGSTCPMQTAKMSEVARKLGPELGAKVNIVSLSLDPERDGVAELRGYADRFGAPADGWFFLTGNPASVDEVLSLFRLRRQRTPDGEVMHLPAAFLLGADGVQVRQYNQMAVKPDTMVDDVRRLLGRG
jgi:protein SCO1/2